MNIKQAKEQLKQTVRAYLSRDEYGDWTIPLVAQRPVLLMGPPGIGKTAIAHQAAQECGVAMVAYSITHHTRQSAIGLPSIRTGSFDGKEFQVTEYTMSEIIASVYKEMEKTGLRQGILFLDEINCVSETLAPAMLQFLQCKTFGSHQVPEGWVIVAAGNPPEYNRSVREFDIVTLDRVRRIDIDEDFPSWKEYAYQRKVHPAILSYLDIKPSHFYKIETTVDGRRFVTARGWEDLSRFLTACEGLDIPVDESVVGQFLQLPAVAKDFANYLDLYKKYQTDYKVEEILTGTFRDSTLRRLREAPFDERLSAISLLLDGVFTACAAANEEDAFVTELHSGLKQVMAALPAAPRWEDPFQTVSDSLSRVLDAQRATGNLEKAAERRKLRVLDTLDSYRQTLRTGDVSTSDQAAEALRTQFSTAVTRRREVILDASARLDNAFSFLEAAFGESQELVVFLTELTMNCYSMRFIRDNGCEKYSQYNQSLLLGGRQRSILDEIGG
ncbi:MAG: MoxR family ATPase [Clostridiales bacterium]|nr:MoxR family ATPase [Clostridiales bacterium]